MTDCRSCRGERPAADHTVADLGLTVATARAARPAAVRARLGI